jgi:hypothetical protein
VTGKKIHGAAKVLQGAMLTSDIKTKEKKKQRNKKKKYGPSSPNCYQ